VETSEDAAHPGHVPTGPRLVEAVVLSEPLFIPLRRVIPYSTKTVKVDADGVTRRQLNDEKGDNGDQKQLYDRSPGTPDNIA
jgi:hypothetical protein